MANELQILVDWDNDGDFEDEGEDITGYVLSASWRFGRNDLESALPAEGELTLQLDNSSQIFSPEHEESYLYGRLIASSNVQVWYTPTADIHTLMFSGFVDTVELEVGTTSSRKATLIARQGLFMLDEVRAVFGSGGLEFPSDRLLELFRKTGWFAAGDNSVFRLNVSALDNGQTTLPQTDGQFVEFEPSLTSVDTSGFGVKSSTPLRKVLEQLIASEQGLLYIDRAGKFGYWQRTHGLNAYIPRDPKSGIFTPTRTMPVNKFVLPDDYSTFWSSSENISVDVPDYEYATEDYFPTLFIFYTNAPATNERLSGGADDVTIADDSWSVPAPFVGAGVFCLYIDHYWFSPLSGVFELWGSNGTTTTKLGEITVPPAELLATLHTTAVTIPEDVTHIALSGVLSASSPGGGLYVQYIMLTEGTAVPTEFNSGFQYPDTRFYNTDGRVVKATYSFGEDTANAITVDFKQKALEKNVKVWETRSPIMLPGLNRDPRFRANTETKIVVAVEPVEADGTPITITRIDPLQTVLRVYRTLSTDENGYVLGKELEDAEQVRRRFKLLVLGDAKSGYSIQLTNLTGVVYYAEVELYGDKLGGGSAQTTTIYDNDSIKKYHRFWTRDVSTNDVSSAEEAAILGQSILDRFAEPTGEISEITLLSANDRDHREISELKIGSVLIISDEQSGLEDAPHMIIAERGEYNGGFLEITYTLRRLPSTPFFTPGMASVSERTADTTRNTEFWYEHCDVFPMATMEPVWRNNRYMLKVTIAPGSRFLIGGKYFFAEPISVPQSYGVVGTDSYISRKVYTRRTDDAYKFAKDSTFNRAFGRLYFHGDIAIPSTPLTDYPYFVFHPKIRNVLNQPPGGGFATLYVLIKPKTGTYTRDTRIKADDGWNGFEEVTSIQYTTEYEGYQPVPLWYDSVGLIHKKRLRIEFIDQEWIGTLVAFFFASAFAAPDRVEPTFGYDGLRIFFEYDETPTNLYGRWRRLDFEGEILENSVPLTNISGGSILIEKNASKKNAAYYYAEIANTDLSANAEPKTIYISGLYPINSADYSKTEAELLADLPQNIYLAG